jgi:hypothetical protein
MENERGSIAWAFLLVAEVLILKNLIELRESTESTLKGYHVIITAPLIPWIFCVSIGIWIILITQRYSEEIRVKTRTKSCYTIFFMVAVLSLTISALAFLDVGTFKKGLYSPALLFLGIAHWAILILDGIIFNLKDQTTIDRIRYFETNNLFQQVIAAWGFRFHSGLALIIFGLIPCKQFKLITLQILIYILLFIIMIYDLISGSREIKIVAE